MGIFSRVLKNPYGSVSFTGPPAGVGETARSTQDIASMLTDQYREGIMHSQRMRPEIEGAYGAASQAALTNAERLGGLYDSYAHPLMEQTYGELAQAGSQARQASEAERAASQTRSMMASQEASQRRELAAQGLVPTGTRNSAAGALAENFAANQARQQERMYGEQARRNMLPFLSQQGDRAVNAHVQGANLKAQEALMPAQLAQGYLPLASTGISGNQIAQDMYGNQWNAENSTRGQQAMFDAMTHHNFMGNMLRNQTRMGQRGLTSGDPFVDAAFATVPFFPMIEGGLNLFNSATSGDWSGTGRGIGAALGGSTFGPLGYAVGGWAGDKVGSLFEPKTDDPAMHGGSSYSKGSGIGNAIGSFVSALNPFD